MNVRHRITEELYRSNNYHKYIVVEKGLRDIPNKRVKCITFCVSCKSPLAI